MAWSPVRRVNAGILRVKHPGDYATRNSNSPRDGTTPDVDDLKTFCMALVAGVERLTSEEKTKLAEIADEVDRLWRESLTEGNMSDGTMAYLDRYQRSTAYTDRSNTRFAEAFPEQAGVSG